MCLSHAGIVSKRLNVGSRKQRHVIAKRLYSRWTTPPPFLLKFALKVTHLLSNTTILTNIAHSASTVIAGEKISSNRSRPRAFQRAIDEPSTLPLLPPNGGTKHDFAFLRVKFNFCLRTFAIKFHCVKLPAAGL